MIVLLQLSNDYHLIALKITMDGDPSMKENFRFICLCLLKAYMLLLSLSVFHKKTSLIIMDKLRVEINEIDLHCGYCGGPFVKPCIL